MPKHTRELVAIPKPELEWILEAMGVAYEQVAGDLWRLRNASERTPDTEEELEVAVQAEEELSLAVDLLSRRLKEALTGKKPAPARVAYVVL